MRFANAVTAAVAGVAVVVVVGPVVPVAVGLALGTVVATAVTLYADTDRYGLAGATFLLGVGTAVLASGWFPAPWARTTLLACWLFGLLSLGVVVARFLLGFVGRRVVAQFVPDEEAGSIWDALSAFAGTLFIAWSVLTAQEKAARTGGIAIGGSTTMVANAAGYELPVVVPFVHEALSVTVRGYELAIPVWALENGIDDPTGAGGAASGQSPGTAASGQSPGRVDSEPAPGGRRTADSPTVRDDGRQSGAGAGGVDDSRQSGDSTAGTAGDRRESRDQAGENGDERGTSGGE
ncbi:hypothetical protein BRC64_06385 [Halobacteriales archaeon QH_10_67_22]|nr:MAG: hypothetical protein BRC64_06385 [Halobacteriales archaeon QH_10_67_22]